MYLETIFISRGSEREADHHTYVYRVQTQRFIVWNFQCCDSNYHKFCNICSQKFCSNHRFRTHFFRMILNNTTRTNVHFIVISICFIIVFFFFCMPIEKIMVYLFKLEPINFMEMITNIFYSMFSIFYSCFIICLFHSFSLAFPQSTADQHLCFFITTMYAFIISCCRSKSANR